MNYYNLHKTLININNIFCDIAIFDIMQQKNIDVCDIRVYNVNVPNKRYKKTKLFMKGDIENVKENNNKSKKRKGVHSNGGATKNSCRTS